MSELKVVALEREERQIPNLRAFDGRYRCIVRYQGHLLTMVLCSRQLSPSREFIQVGGFYSDQVSRHWSKVDDIDIVEVLAKIDVTDDKPLPWWKRAFLRRPRHGR